MIAKSRMTAMAVALLAADSCFAQMPPSTAEEPAPAPVAGSEFFNVPRINDALNDLQKGQTEPTSEVPGLEVGTAAPTYRTMKEAAGAGINPLASPQGRLTIRTISEPEVPGFRLALPYLLGGAALMLVGLIVFGAVLTVRVRRGSAQ